MPAPHWIELFSLLAVDTCRPAVDLPPQPWPVPLSLGPYCQQISFQMSTCILPSDHLTLSWGCSPCSLMLLRAFSEAAGGGGLESAEEWRFINQKIIMECTLNTAGWKRSGNPKG